MGMVSNPYNIKCHVPLSHNFARCSRFYTISGHAVKLERRVEKLDIVTKIQFLKNNYLFKNMNTVAIINN